MSAIVKGQQGMVFRGVSRRYVPGQGDSTVFVYDSGSLLEAQNFYSSQRAVGTNAVTIDEAGPPYTVEVASPDTGTSTDESYEDQWELPAIQKENNLLEIPEFQALPDAVRQAIKEYAESSKTFDEALTAINDAYGTPVAAGDDAYEILLLLSKGSDSYPSPSSLLRWTRIVNRNYQAIADAYDSVNYVFSTATLVANTPMPANIVSAVQLAAGALPSPATGYVKGWLKQQPTITYRGAGRIEITQEWTLENWNDWLYFNT